MTPPTVGYSPVDSQRHDRRRKPASPAEYLDLLAERDCIDRPLVGGGGIGAIVRNVSVSVTQHGRDEHPGAVLNDRLADGNPVLLMGNTVDQFMREMKVAITDQARTAADSKLVYGVDTVENIPTIRMLHA